MWDKTFDSGTSWIHMNGFKKRSNANAFYSPGVDRFFAVDSLDPYTAFEVAQILSGKMPGISVCVLSGDDAWFDNNNCHEYTLAVKSVLMPGNSVLYNRQIPTIRKIPPRSIAHVGGMTADYTDNNNYQTFLEFKLYAQFVIQCWHSAKICEMYFNFAPMEMYTQDFFGDAVPTDFATPVDNVNGQLKTGITKEIKKILYDSNSSAEALATIADMWRKNLTPLSVHWKDLFYRSLTIDPPADLKSADANIEQYSGFLL